MHLGYLRLERHGALQSGLRVVAHHPTVTLFLQRERFLGLARAHPKVFVELYELAVHRDQETATAASADAAETDDFVLV